MQQTASVPTVPVAAWTAILDRVEQALSQTMAELGEQGLDPQPPPARTGGEETAWRQRLEQCAARLNQLQSCVRQAEEHAAEADSALRTSEEALQGWLAVATAARQRLENREGHPV